MQKTTLNITGMTCKHCVATVENSLNETAGVKKASVSLGKQNAKVKFDENETSVAELIQVIQNAGYSAEE
ncbi:copper ion binding protein [Pilibacter termitis]|jgi:copper ion binding protein|uniref:Copper chaperone CopZ n=1 Tax=Pilibacter termitis TaxID=263852 RepID=A0A1T4R699_9ENTE|nr:copper ion binding protein [Pilibacter termitis]SKA11188.1 copper ion binding protein [Pilibacter termitis]